MKFNKKRKGYNPEEVDKYLLDLTLEHEANLRKKDARIEELKISLAQAEQKLKAHDEKSELVNKVMFNAVAKADEIERLATVKYNQEIEQLKIFHEKWVEYFNKILSNYPLDSDMLSASEFNNRMKKILSNVSKPDFGSGLQIKDILERNFEEENNKLDGSTEKQIGYIKIKTDTKTKDDESVLKEILPDGDLSSPILTGNFDPIERIGKYFSAEAETTKPQSKKKSRSKKEGVATADNDDEDEFSDRSPSGFSFEEALNPKDDLAEIMRDLGLLIDEK